MVYIKKIIFPVLITLIVSISWIPKNEDWIIDKHKDYNFLYTPSDWQNITEYSALVENALSSVKYFFRDSGIKKFDIYIHPNRRSLDSTWQKDWKLPDFKSECWMVASGVGNRFDMISPKLWDKEACEHSYSDTLKTQQLITHELVHVYHGQHNVSPDFSDVTGLDWFVEGLATYASGQCDNERINQIKQAIAENKIPQGLDNFWSGKLKYGLSASVIMYIDNKYGRQKIKELLKFNKKTDVLKQLNCSEANLLAEWKSYIQKV